MKEENTVTQEKAPTAQQEEDELLQKEHEEDDTNQVLQYLAPWLEKTGGLETIGNWETTLATRMMVKIMELWLSLENRKKVAKILQYYHPVDRAAMAYALVVFVLTGHQMEFRSVVAQRHYNVACKLMEECLPLIPPAKERVREQ